MIGYYVHHHGAGHAQRFGQIAALMPEVVGLGSGPRPAGVGPDRWIALPIDTDDETEPVDPTAGGSLHWAPVGVPGLTERTAAIASWVAAQRPAAMVVDVSVEVALTARLLSMPTVIVAQHGTRTDLPHELAYRGAAAVAALWPAGAADDPPHTAGRLHHVGPISRFDGAPSSASDVEPDRDGRRRVLTLLGAGGHGLPSASLREAIAATDPAWEWCIAGGFPELGGRALDGDDLWRELHRADVVVATAGNNAVAEVAAARRPLVAVPQDRPFDEQHAHARSLERLGLATTLDGWPAPDRWSALLDRAAGGGEGWAGYHDGLGAQRLAAVISGVVGRR